MQFKPLNGVRSELGEGPVYDDRRNALFQCDILAKVIHCFDLATGAHRHWSFPSEVGSIGLAESGRLVVALRHTVGLFDPDEGRFAEICAIEADRGGDTRLNDGKVGPDGAFWVGSMDNRGMAIHQPLGTLYRVTADGKAEAKVPEVVISNGLAFSPDGRSMFHSDSNAGWLDRWDLDPATGAISNRNRIAHFDAALGWPDGAATDIEGNYWSAGISGQCLNRFAPDGRLIQRYPVPVAAPTMPAFGGADLRTLFVTSLTIGRAPEELARFPLTGITLVGRSPVAGSPVARFRDT